MKPGWPETHVWSMVRCSLHAKGVPGESCQHAAGNRFILEQKFCFVKGEVDLQNGPSLGAEVVLRGYAW